MIVEATDATTRSRAIAIGHFDTYEHSTREVYLADTAIFTSDGVASLMRAGLTTPVTSQPIFITSFMRSWCQMLAIPLIYHHRARPQRLSQRCQVAYHQFSATTMSSVIGTIQIATSIGRSAVNVILYASRRVIDMRHTFRHIATEAIPPNRDYLS